MCDAPAGRMPAPQKANGKILVSGFLIPGRLLERPTEVFDEVFPSSTRCQSSVNTVTSHTGPEVTGQRLRRAVDLD